MGKVAIIEKIEGVKADIYPFSIRTGWDRGASLTW